MQQRVLGTYYGPVGVFAVVNLYSLSFGPPQTINRQKELGI